jgi:hypothetical protein
MCIMASPTRGFVSRAQLGVCVPAAHLVAVPRRQLVGLTPGRVSLSDQHSHPHHAGPRLHSLPRTYLALSRSAPCRLSVSADIFLYYCPTSPQNLTLLPRSRLSVGPLSPQCRRPAQVNLSTSTRTTLLQWSLGTAQAARPSLPRSTATTNLPACILPIPQCPMAS